MPPSSPSFSSWSCRTQRHTHKFNTKSLQICLAFTSILFVGKTNALYELYEAKNDVEPLLLLGLDIKEMLSANNFDEKKNIYVNGKNAQPLTLAGLSTSKADEWSNHFMYNLYRGAFDEIGNDEEGDDIGKFDGNPVSEYANTLVDDLFSLSLVRIEAEGALVYNVLMAYWTELTELLHGCKTAGPANLEASKDAMRLSLDRAAAYWIGKDQLPGEADTGHMFYSLAETTGPLFGQKVGESSTVNNLVLTTFDLIIKHIDDGLCANPGDKGERAYTEMRDYVQRLIKYSNTVVLQMLLWSIERASIEENMADHVALYALSVLPQVWACDKRYFKRILELTVVNDVTNATRDFAISAIQGAYSCMHVTCADVGAFEENKIPQCLNEAQQLSMAGYVSQTDVRTISYMDRDIKMLSAQMMFGAFDTAQDIYHYGWNGNFFKGQTLRNLATNNYSPTTSAEFNLFASYFSDGIGFADIALTKIFQTTTPFDIFEDYDRYALARSLLRTVVMYLAVTGEVDSAVEACKSDADPSQVHRHWDSAAALMIGSAEGFNAGGQDGGESLYAHTKKFCEALNKCGAESSVVGEELVVYFNRGTQHVADKSCDKILKLVSEDIKPTLLIPLIQGSIFYTDAITDNVDDMDIYLADMYGFTEAILPAFNTVDPNSETIISRNRDVLFSNGDPVQPTQVYDAIRTGLAKMSVNCEDIGKIATQGMLYGFCEGDVPAPVLAQMRKL